MVTGKIPENCNECHDRHVCGAAYGSTNCLHREAIEFKAMYDRLAESAQHQDDAKPKQKQDVVKNPQHYKHGEFEVIDEMLIVFGPMRTYDFCILNAWKYRARALYKGNCEQDLAKADQYLKMAYEIQQANEYTIPPLRLIKYGAPEAPKELKAVRE